MRGGGSSPTQHQHKTLTHLSIPPPPPLSNQQNSTISSTNNNNLTINTSSASNQPTSTSPLSLKGSLLSSYEADTPPPLARDPNTGKFAPMSNGSNSPVNTNTTNTTQSQPQSQPQPSQPQRKTIIGSLSRGLGFGGSK